MNDKERIALLESVIKEASEYCEVADLNKLGSILARANVSKRPAQETSRDMWLLCPLGSMGRKTIQFEQYEELRALANKLARMVKSG